MGFLQVVAVLEDRLVTDFHGRSMVC